MPYIDQDARQFLENALQLDDFLDTLYTLSEDGEMPVGSINYVISRIIHDWVHAHGESYETLNAAIGVLECAKLEYTRAVVAKYEKKKAKDNGDVFYYDRTRPEGQA